MGGSQSGEAMRGGGMKPKNAGKQKDERGEEKNKQTRKHEGGRKDRWREGG